MTTSPYKTPAAPLDAELAAPKESDFVKAFLSFIVCALFAGAISGAIIGGIIGGVWGSSGSVDDAAAFGITVMVFSGILSLIVNYFVFRFFVKLFIVEKLSPSPAPAA